MGKALELAFKLKAQAQTDGIDKAVAAAKAGSTSIVTEIEKIKKEAKQTSDVVGKEAKTVKKELKDVESANKDLSKSFSDVASTGNVVIAVIAAIGTAAIGAGVGIFKLTKATADYVREIGKANEATGISVETLSALKFVAEQNSESFGVWEKALANFSATLADAATGSDSAKAKLKRLGIDPQEGINDLDAALEKVLKRIVGLKNPVDKAKATNDAFGADMANNLIPTINSFNGNLGNATDKAREFGLLISGETVAAGKQFDKSYKELTTTLSGMAVVIGGQLLPVINDLFTDTSKGLKTNQDDWKSWGNAIAGTIIGVRAEFTLLKLLLGGMSPALAFTVANQELGRRKNNLLNPAPVGDTTGTPQSGLNDPGAGAKRKREADKARREAKRSFEKHQRDLSESNKLRIRNEEAEFKRFNDSLSDQFEARQITEETFRKKSLQNLGNYLENVRQLTDNARKIELQGKTGLERRNINERFNQLGGALTDRDVKERAVIEKLITKVVETEHSNRVSVVSKSGKQLLAIQRAQNDKYIASIRLRLEQGKAVELELLTEKQKIAREELTQKKKQLIELLKLEKVNSDEYKRIGNAIKVLDTEYHTLKTEQQIERIKLDKKINDEIFKRLELEALAYEKEKQREQERLAREAPQTDKEFDPDTASDPNVQGGFGDLLEAIAGEDIFTDFEGKALSTTNVVGAAFEGLGDIVGNVFLGMRDALAQSIEGYVLYGDSIGKALKKALAAQLAHVTAMAALKALESTAWGFYHLATFNFKAAGVAFIAAGLWGALALGSGVAGRALAGNNGTQGAFGSSSGNIDLRSPQSVQQRDPSIVEERQGRQEIVLRLDRGLVGEMVKDDFNNGGETRTLLLELVEGT